MQVVPQGIESVNGSSMTMGCTSPLVDSGGVMVCGSQSYLVDGCSPDIDTSTSDWASQLVTVRRNGGTAGINFAHVLLTFGFDTAVSLTGIEMDLFNCPDWNIGAPSIALYLNPDYNLAATTDLLYSNGLPFVLVGDNSLQSSCDSLSAGTFSGGSFQSESYRTVYILVDLSHTSSIQWVHVGEVRFIGIDSPTCLQPTSPSLPISNSPKTTLNPAGTTNLNTYSTYQMKPETSSTPETSPSDQSDNTIIFALVAITAGLILLACFLTSLVVFLVRKRSCCTQAKNATKTVLYELEKRSTLRSSIENHIEATNPILLSSANDSRYVCPDASLDTNSCDEHYDIIKKEFICPADEAYYDVVARDEPPPAIQLTQTGFPKNNTGGRHYEAIPLPTETPAVASLVKKDRHPEESMNAQSNTPFTSDEDDGGHYEVIPLRTTSASLVKEAQHPPPYEKSPNAQPNSPFSEDDIDGGHYEVIPLLERATTTASHVKRNQHPLPSEADSANALSDSSGKSFDEAGRIYSVVRRKNAPIVPEKNTDLKDYLAVQIFNENIYSEPINPSDFISQQPEPEEELQSDPIIYAPIYPSFTELPESFELPVEVNSRNVEVDSSLRTGHYGDVVLASTVGLSLKDLHLSRTETNKNVSVTVAMKKLKLDATPIQRRAFETEAKFLSRLRHPNVVRLLGACYEDPVFIMMEYMKDGDLSQFLQKYSEVVSIATPSSTTQITQSTLVFMASQICSGMKQLAALNFIHRDLTTRNCLVGNNFSVKVASFGVDKDIYQSHYFRVQGNTLLPIRWMATECFDGKFSEKSDVWAFGVTMWEMFTLAKQLPYRHLSDEEVIHNALKREYRQFPTRSSSCPQSVYEIMERCWVMDFNERITFGELQTLLHTVL